MDWVFAFLLWPKRKARRPWKQGRKKRGSITCPTDWANEANKMFILWLCWLFRFWKGDRELEVRTATYGPGIDQSQHAKSVSHIINQDIHRATNAARWISWAFTDTEVNNNVSIYPTSESVRNRPFKKNQIIQTQSRALSRSLISEYPGYSLISEPIRARKKHYSLVGYMLTVDIYFLLSNQSTCKVLFT